MYKFSPIRFGAVFVCGIFIFFGFLTITHGQCINDANASSTCYNLINPLGPADSVEGVTCKVVDFIAKDLMPPIAVLMALWASFLLLTSTGDPGKMVQARQVLVWTVIGAGILILAPALLSLVISGVFGGGAGGSAPYQCTQAAATSTVADTLVAIINWFSWFLSLLAVAVGLYSGFLYMTANGDARKLAIANKTLFYAIIGVAVGLLAFGIIALVNNFIVP